MGLFAHLAQQLALELYGVDQRAVLVRSIHARQRVQAAGF